MWNFLEYKNEQILDLYRLVIDPYKLTFHQAWAIELQL